MLTRFKRIDLFQLPKPNGRTEMKAYKKYIVSGRVIDHCCHAISNLKIEAWDKDLLIDDFLGSSMTDSHGKFSIIFDSSKFQEIFFDNNPDVFFKIYRNVMCNMRKTINYLGGQNTFKPPLLKPKSLRFNIANFDKIFIFSWL